MEDGPEEIGTPYAPQALGAYSQAVKAGGFVFVSGQLGIDPDTGELVEGTAADQATQALKNVKNILDAAGTGMEKVVKATILMRRVEDFTQVDQAYSQVFIGSVRPARMAFGGADIPKGALVEIEVVALA